jgi:hypothetical protein
MLNFLIAIIVIYIVIPHSSIDNRLEISYNRVMNLIEKDCKNVMDYFPQKYYINTFKASKNTKYIGICRKNIHIFEVSIDVDFLDYSSEEDLDNLMAHELLHCIFNQDHVDEPNNLMNSQFQYRLQPSLEEQISKFTKQKCKN